MEKRQSSSSSTENLCDNNSITSFVHSMRPYGSTRSIEQRILDAISLFCGLLFCQQSYCVATDAILFVCLRQYCNTCEHWLFAQAICRRYDFFPSNRSSSSVTRHDTKLIEICCYAYKKDTFSFSAKRTIKGHLLRIRFFHFR